jgi:hypothetical protein
MRESSASENLVVRDVRLFAHSLGSPRFGGVSFQAPLNRRGAENAFARFAELLLSVGLAVN